MRVCCIVTCPMALVFLCDQDREEGVVKLMMDTPIFSRLGFFSLIFWVGQGVTSIRIAWNDKNVTCSCVPDAFSFASAGRSTQT